MTCEASLSPSCSSDAAHDASAPNHRPDANHPSHERSDAVRRVDVLPATQMLTETVRSWSGVTLKPHRFRAVAFRWKQKEIGHLHTSGILDVPFPKRIRDLLVEAKEATAHRYVPDSGWVTARIATTGDVDHATYLLQLSYLYRRIIRARTAADRACIRADLDDMRMRDDLREIYDDLLTYRSETSAAPPARTWEDRPVSTDRREASGKQRSSDT